MLAATIVALVTLFIATFELSMADFPSGLVIMGILPLAALLFFTCLRMVDLAIAAHPQGRREIRCFPS